MTRPTDETVESSTRATAARTFLLVTLAGALQGWEIGFDYGAFDTISYRRVFAVFVVCTVVLITTVVVDDESFVTSWFSRGILALPLLYILADLTFLTASQAVVEIFSFAVLVTLPYALFVVARMIDTDYFSLPGKLQVVAMITVITIAFIGWYVGNANDRFLSCTDFELVGDYQPENCVS